MSNDGMLFYDVCVVGGGPAGLFVASKFANTGLKVAILETCGHFGGQLCLYKDKKVKNLPLIKEMQAENVYEAILNSFYKKKNATLLHSVNIKQVSRNEDKSLKEILFFDNEKEEKIACKYIILAVGKGANVPNEINVDGADVCRDKSLFYSVNDKTVFYNKIVVIAGGGDSVIDWTVEMQNIAKKVIVVCRREIVRVENPNFNKFLELNKSGFVEEKNQFLIEKINHNSGFISSVIISNINGNSSEEIDCDYLLAFYGTKTLKYDMLNKFVGFKIDESKNGIDVNQATMETREKNIFAIGDCCNYEGKIKNIPFGVFEGLKCFYEICKREDDSFNIYEKNNNIC